MVQLLNDPSNRIRQVTEWLSQQPEMNNPKWEHFIESIEDDAGELRRRSGPLKDFSKPHSRANPGLHANPDGAILEEAATEMNRMAMAMKSRDRLKAIQCGERALAVLAR